MYAGTSAGFLLEYSVAPTDLGYPSQVHTMHSRVCNIFLCLVMDGSTAVTGSWANRTTEICAAN